MAEFHVPTFFFIFFLASVNCSRDVTLSCGRDEELERGLPGSPGKRGAVGLKGDKGEPGIAFVGSKGEKGEIGDCKEVIAKLEEKVMQLELKLNESILAAPVESRHGKSPQQRNWVQTARDCNEVGEQGFTSSGVYNITLEGRIVPVYCDMETDGGNWLVFQRRSNGEENFFLGWQNYSEGFGNVQEEFWLGLETLHLITSSGSFQLRIDLEDWNSNRAFAVYNVFSVGDSASKYRLRISGYSGTAGNGLNYHNNKKFSTHDSDNDNRSSGSCADSYKGAWWYSSCGLTNLNGIYLRGGIAGVTGITWRQWKHSWYSLKKTEMKIRRN